jgi:hypothetical protein
VTLWISAVWQNLISLADFETLHSKEMRYVPLTYWEHENTLDAFGNHIRMILSLNHPLKIEYKAMWTLLQGGLCND